MAEYNNDPSTLNEEEVLEAGASYEAVKSIN